MAKNSLMLIIALFFIVSGIETAMAKKCEALLQGPCEAAYCTALCSKTYSGPGTCVQGGCLCTYDSGSPTSPCIGE
ncbi:defensin-like protein 156 [Vicia villosa]|uniref:defensin-like protein 156 n=1 Tax=Vicia villosa TaxID=3911 RepID=UPI00273CAC6B|nr:defensin-like protein 156 [Vicia villosa]